MTKQNIVVIFVHGYNASSQKDWFQYVASDLQKLSIDSYIPDLPGGEHPHATVWIDKLHQLIVSLSLEEKEIIFVGHSLGCRAILLFLEKYPIKTKGVLLVATHNNSTENAVRHKNEHKDFWKHKIDTEKVKTHVEKFVIMHAVDDPVIPYDLATQLQQELHAVLLSYPDKLHFSTIKNGPFILDAIKKEFL